MKKICDAARAKGVKTIVDGAHAFAHFPFNAADLGCDYYGTSLHKWLLAPIGTGFLYVRRENIEGLWSLTPAGASRAKDIRKFEEIGTHPAANHNAIAEALTFHDGIGIERKAARLRYLRNRWADRLKATGRFRIHTSLDPAQSCAIGTVQVLGVRNREGRAAAVGQVADHRDADQPRRVHRHPRHAERLHDARGDRYVRRRDGEDRSASGSCVYAGRADGSGHEDHEVHEDHEELVLVLCDLRDLRGRSVGPFQSSYLLIGLPSASKTWTVPSFFSAGSTFA